MSHVRPAFVLLVLFTLLTGALYPLAITGLGQALFSAQANGSLVTRDGQVIGSGLIGQAFTSDRFFHGRPSVTTGADPADPATSIAAPYNAASSTGSNLGPTSSALVTAVEARARALGAGPQPADLVTASASGLDPHISPAAAYTQVNRVAAARGLSAEAVRDLVTRSIERRELGVLGEPRVNVLALNVALDALRP
jgi:potassium-transporting ATPase KdpC subunit